MKKAKVKKKKFNKHARRKELDKMWSLRVRQRDGFVCQQCIWEVSTGKKPPIDAPKPDKHNHAHHIVSKAQGLACRWDIRNGVCLCYIHHIFKIGQDPLTFAKFLNEWLKERDLDFDIMKRDYSEVYVKLDEDYYNLKKMSLTEGRQNDQQECVMKIKILNYGIGLIK